MKGLVQSVLFSGLLSTTAAAAELACTEGAPLTIPVRLDYVVTASRSILSLKGDGEVVFQRKGDAYVMESSLQALGLLEAHQSSVGTVKPAGLVPRVFTQRSSRRPQRNVKFDWAAQRVSYSQSGESLPTRPQMQDRLSLVMQLAWRHHNDPLAREIEVPVAGLRHDSDFVFSSKGNEVITVPGGRYDTTKYERRKDDGDDTLEVWLAPSLCSLPVRLRFTDDKGLVIDQQLRAVHPL